MGLEQRDRVRWAAHRHNWKQEDADDYAKQAVQYRQESRCTRRICAVRVQWGSAPASMEQTIEQFETDLKGNLYRIWNRMSSGAYFPPPVRAVSIPKKSGGQRIFGVPTVADRVAQTVVKRRH